MSIIPPLHPSYQNLSKSILPCPLSHLNIRPTRTFINPFYHVYYPTLTSVLPEPLKIRSTMSIIQPLHPSYRESFLIRSTMSIIPPLYPSYQNLSKSILPCPLSLLDTRLNRSLSNLFYHESFLSVYHLH